ncbi:MAG TPA: alpha/beta hydrolase [Candidatus Megaira endosymbiont of Nemacystus decipiens]|nr:alpha/beta hydrolase [Candidatus Megaera endosymbiont of Nemacystus decipiens]
MTILNINNENKIIAYKKHIATKFDSPTIIFHHGFMSDMNGDKATYIEKYCIDHNFNFIRYDNYGSGESSGLITEQTLSTWLNAGRHIINELTTKKNIIHVGSSLGAWIATILSLENPKQTVGLINIAPAFDFTENLIWDKFTQEEQNKLLKEKIYYLTTNDKSYQYSITLDLILDARQYLLLNKNNIQVNHPVHLIHGMKDAQVDYRISQKFVEKISGGNVVLKLVQEGNHKLSRKQDLELISSSISEIISCNNLQ